MDTIKPLKLDTFDTFTVKKHDVYKQNGHSNRESYLESLADDFGLSLSIVWEIADNLGESEDFDGLISALTEYVDYWDGDMDDMDDDYIDPIEYYE